MPVRFRRWWKEEDTPPGLSLPFIATTVLHGILAGLTPATVVAGSVAVKGQHIRRGGRYADWSGACFGMEHG